MMQSHALDVDVSVDHKSVKCPQLPSRALEGDTSPTDGQAYCIFLVIMGGVVPQRLYDMACEN